MKPDRLLSSQEVATAAGVHVRRVQQLRARMAADGIRPEVLEVGRVTAYRWPPEAVSWIRNRRDLRRERMD